MRLFRKIIFFVALTCGCSAFAAEPDTLRLSRQDCVAIALNESQTVKISDIEVKKADYSKKEVLANLFPGIDFTGAYQRAIELQSLNMSMGGMSQTIKMGTDNNWNLGFSASMPLINPTLWKSIGLSDTQILQSLESARASRLDLINNINKAYYALLLAIDSREVIRQNYDLAKLNAEIFERQFKAGTASEYDMLRSQVQVTNVEPELLQADIAVRQCQLQLAVLMGIQPEAPIMPTVNLRDMQQEMYGYYLGNDRNLENNTSLRSIDLSRKLATQNVTLQKLAWVPTLAASFNLNWSAMSNGNPFQNQHFNPYSNVGLALQIPIFHGGAKYQKLRQAKAQLTQIDLQRETLLNSLNMQVDLALDNINRQVNQISSSEKGMETAAKAREIMQKSFEIGAASYLNVRDSEMALTSAQLAYYQAIYNYLVSTSELDTLLGREEALGIK